MEKSYSKQVKAPSWSCQKGTNAFRKIKQCNGKPNNSDGATLTNMFEEVRFELKRLPAEGEPHVRTFQAQRGAGANVLGRTNSEDEEGVQCGGRGQ